MDTYFIKAAGCILDINELRGIQIQSSSPRFVVVASFRGDSIANLFYGTQEECQQYIDGIYDQIDEYQTLVKKLWSEGAE